MKIAIVAPSPVPYTVGGAEKLWWGMLNALNQLTPHQIELIKRPTPERNFWELMQSYQMFSELNLDHFDLIISTKYPAWMVSHPNHHCYLQHRLRGLYDTYHFCRKPLELPGTLPAPLNRVRKLITGQPEREVLPELFAELAQLKQRSESDPKVAEALAFPGPLSRALVHFLDAVALNPQSIQRFSAISRNVAQRADYFPPEVPVQVIHHPSDVEDYCCSGYNDLFTISRLDGAKRIRWLIEAFMATRTDRQFLIAGTGPEEAELKARAASDPRIRFLGRITDEEVLQHYANALFVPFIPYDEDYGLITIEAMSSGKAVLTTQDAGGVNEFVENGVSGLSVEPSIEALTQGMQTLLDDPAHTRAMGEQAKQKVAHISWQNTLQKLLPDSIPLMLPGSSQTRRNQQNSAPLPRIAVAVNFPVYPPKGGGQSRIFHLYRALSRFAEVTLITQCALAEDAGSFQISEHFREVRVQKSPEQRQLEQALAKTLKASVDDVAAIEGVMLSPAYLQALAEHTAHAQWVIASHPYLYKAIQAVYQGKLWYEAHNVEYDMKRAVLAQGSNAMSEDQSKALALVKSVEAECIQAADSVLACSEGDLARLDELYSLAGKASQVVPNGVCLEAAPYLDWPGREQLQTRLGTRHRFQALFMGSWHGPNIEAVEQISQIAQQCPLVDFLLIGSVCNHPICCNLPGNVHPLGLVSEAEKAILLNAVDLALNPMASGSGTNLKMLEYAATGTPILTTEFGNRGLLFQPGKDVLIAPVSEFGRVIQRLSEEKTKNPSAYAQQCAPRAEQAYQTCSTHYDWEVIAGQLADRLLPSVEKAQ